MNIVVNMDHLLENFVPVDEMETQRLDIVKGVVKKLVGEFRSLSVKAHPPIDFQGPGIFDDCPDMQYPEPSPDTDFFLEVRGFRENSDECNEPGNGPRVYSRWCALELPTVMPRAGMCALAKRVDALFG